ncbi:MAG TPA: VacB/RNase II family 3'-5' exoribonuclease [Planctomycetota bacterium]
MNNEHVKAELFKLLGEPGYAPMRKRALARELRISDEDYRSFRGLLNDLAKAEVIVEMKHGKYALPMTDAREGAPLAPRRAEAATVGRASLPAQAESEPEAETESELERFRQLEKAKTAATAGGKRIGRIDVRRGGMGFLLSEPPGNDIFIGAEDLCGAMDGDLVQIEMKRRGSGGAGRQGGRRGRFGGGMSRPAGRVVKILERAHPRIVGTFYTEAGVGRSLAGHIVPDTRGMFQELDVLAGDALNAKNRDKVSVELIESAERHRTGGLPTAKIVKVFGPAGQADADILAILENYNIKTSFPDEVLRAAEAVPEDIPEEELAQRIDYTQPITFTIDPADAKDHDDAVALRREEDGRYTLLVHIADVSYYVAENSIIDLEARARGTSVYLPGTVYPMLPQKLSNNMCSLKAGQLRLTKTARITFSKNLMPQDVHIERSYIRSAAFLTYDQVREAIDENKPELVHSPEIFEALKEMRDFAAALRQKRLSTGSLELDLPEARILLDEKLEVKGWAKVEHHWAHELIEDMMLAANRAVAEYLVDHELPGLFRIHEDPDPEALERFAEFVRELGISLRPPIDRLKLKSVLDRVHGKDYAHTVHLALLTSLKKARYSSECHPHFALNFNRYLHFTSPIRRYPDLIVHRALDSRFEPGQATLPVHGKKRAGGVKGVDYFERQAWLRPLAAHCSLREREAEDAEEEVIKFRQMQFLRRNLKEAHPGIIKGVRDFGFFVELQDCYVEGLVRVQSLEDDWYEYYENQHMLQGRKRRRSFRLGDKVSVRILHIDLGKKEVDLEVV